jgi:hypothetical protein
MEYGKRLHTRERIESLAGNFLRVLRELIAESLKKNSAPDVEGVAEMNLSEREFEQLLSRVSI